MSPSGVSQQKAEGARDHQKWGCFACAVISDPEKGPAIVQRLVPDMQGRLHMWKTPGKDLVGVGMTRAALCYNI